MHVQPNQVLAQDPDKKHRYDRKGSLITTSIGTFSLANRKASLAQRKSLNATMTGLTNNSDTGGPDLKKDTMENSDSSPEPKASKKQRHKVTFMDEVTSDKTQLT